MPIGDTIVARATAPGHARRTLIRISGPETETALGHLGVNLPHARGAYRTRATVYNQNDLPLLALRFVAPASYTGQEAAELVIPANPTLTETLIDRLCEVEGVRRAGPGEFSSRAYLAGKLTLAQAEGVAAKIAAESANALSAADRVLSGRAGDEHRAWAQQLATLLALVEAGIDFNDQEDVLAISSQTLGDRLERLIRTLTTAIGPAHASWSSDRPLVTLVGPPNAGKSTLFNALLGTTRVVAAPVPGTTRDAILEPLDLSEHASPPVDLADLPGLDPDAQTPIEHAAQASARRMLDHTDLILRCSAPDSPMMPIADSRNHASPHPFMLHIATKADHHLPNPHADLSVCAMDGWHVSALKRLIASHAFASRRADDSALIPRHREHAARARDFMKAAHNALQDQPVDELLDAEVIAGLLRSALDHLGEITGQITPDAIIGRIFASFCIGK